MPSRAAHRDALRRFKEPSVVPPDGMTAMPELPAPFAWRNPVIGNDYDRSEWEAYYVTSGGSVTIARVNRYADGSCNVRVYAPPAPDFTDQQVAEVETAFNLVVDLAQHHPRKN